MKKYITVFKQEKYDGEWPSEELPKFVEWMTEKLNSIPEEYRCNATIEIESVSSYEDSHYPRIEILYWRPETKEEEAKRLDDENRRHLEQIAKEMRMLETLQAKYGKKV